VEGVASNGVLGESRPKGMLASNSLVLYYFRIARHPSTI